MTKQSNRETHNSLEVTFMVLSRCFEGKLRSAELRVPQTRYQRGILLSGPSSSGKHWCIRHLALTNAKSLASAPRGAAVGVVDGRPSGVEEDVSAARSV